MKNLLLIACLIGLLSACASSTDSAEAYKGETQHQIFTRGKEALEDKSYSEAIKRFEALDIQYPYGADTEWAQLYVIYAYYMKEEYPLAAAAADHFIRLHPAHPHADYAYYMRGLSNFYQSMGVMERMFTIDLATRDLTQLQKSFFDFSELVMKYPHSYYTASGYQYMVYLRNMMADHELQVSRFYYDRRAYVAAVDRASNVVLHFEGAPAVKNALVLLADPYHELGESKLEQDTLNVLKYNGISR